MTEHITQRRSGIDLLKILCMFGILLFHIFDFGLDRAVGLSQRAAWLLRSATFVSVDCYGMISGYLLWNKKIHYRNLAMLWLQVEFYSVLIWVIFRLFLPRYVTPESLVQAVFPLFSEQYWYFTAYAGLFVLMPLLNAGIRGLSQREARLLMLLLLLLFSPVQTLTWEDPFHVYQGKSMIWLVMLYLQGGLLGKTGLLEKWSKRKLMLTYVGCTITAWLSMSLMSRLSMVFYPDYRLTDRLMNHQSPFMLVGAAALVICFDKLDTGRWRKWISRLCPLTFAVYLIHVHPLIWKNLLPDSCLFMIRYPMPVMLALAIITALVIMAISMGVDALRLVLFRSLGLKEKLTRLENRILGE